MKVTLCLTEYDLVTIQHIYFLAEASKRKLMEQIRGGNNTEEEIEKNDHMLEQFEAITNLMDMIYWATSNKVELAKEKKEKRGCSNYRPCKDRDPYKAWTKPKKTTSTT